MSFRWCMILQFVAFDVVADITPAQLHLAFAGDTGTGMAVSWQTTDKAESIVEYGFDSLTSRAVGDSVSYYDTYSHTVVIDGLSPGSSYLYRVGDGNGNVSETYSFTTAASNDVQNVTFAIIADHGRRQHNGGASLDLLKKSASQYDFVWHNGDISYADDAFLHEPFRFGYEDAWNEYMDQMYDAFSATTPWMVAPGNHEVECHSPACQLSLEKARKLSNFSAYNARFRMPSAESKGSANMWYSFNHGPVHIVSINTETDFLGAPNDNYEILLHSKNYNGGFCDAFGCGNWLTWLEQDLASVDRNLTPWLLVGGHRPIYSVIDADADGKPSGSAASLQSAVEHLFFKYGVDMYFCGHEHSYERSFPVYNGTKLSESYADPAGPVYIVDGAGGEDEGFSDYSDAVDADWNAIWNNTLYGYGVLHVSSATELTWTHYSAASGNVIDTIKVTKSQPTPVFARSSSLEADSS